MRSFLKFLPSAMTTTPCAPYYLRGSFRGQYRDINDIIYSITWSVWDRKIFKKKNTRSTGNQEDDGPQMPLGTPESISCSLWRVVEICFGMLEDRDLVKPYNSPKQW